MTDATTTSAPLESRVTDFSSRLSPVLVKELRQGMRTNLFVIAFILLQTFMILCLLAGIANPGSRDADGFFWFFIIATLLVVQPLRGFSALSSEYQLNTMDLIQLTRLDGWRITLGKWTALNAQGLLFLTGVLPYLVIRYYLGNVNFVSDLLILGAVGFGSGLATAVTIGCSVFKNIILRGIILAAMVVTTTSIYGIMSTAVFGIRGTGMNIELGVLFSFAATYGIIFFLSFGASRIAPLSENLATRKRLIAIGFALLAQLFSLFGLKEEIFVVTGFILGLAAIDALTEPLPIFSRVLAPFRERPFGKIAAIFLTPGWLSGLAFFILSCVIFLGSLIFLADPSDLDRKEDWLMLLSILNLFIFPLLIIHLFFANHGSHHFTFGLYIFIQGGLFILTLMIVAIGNALSKYESLIYLCVPLPSVFVYAAGGTRADSPLHFAITIGTTVLCLAFPLLRHRTKLKEFARALKSTPSEDAEPAREN
ncbi:MAG: hypothetical protein P1U68_07600 [Verrucomicrobiales bacterium]|nr:hypothetical protein [Verrucomicrobiales bacterium]